MAFGTYTLNRERLSAVKTAMKMFGPAWLAMMADTDASSLIGGAQSGATYGYGLIWIFLILIIPLIIVQELAGRISVATGKGLGQVVRENYSRRLSLIMTVPMAVTDVITYGIEYVGIAIGLEVLGLSIYYTIPVVYIIHILLVTKRKYVQAEKPLLIISAFLMGALTLTLLYRGILPYNSPLSNPFLFQTTPTYFFLLAANVGAVIMPFMIFFQASATGVKIGELERDGFKIEKKRAARLMRKETIVGAIVTELLMVIIEMTFSGIPKAQDSSVFATAHDLGQVLTPIAGPYSLLIFGIGLIAAAFIALIVISLASAWGIAESLSISKKSLWMVYVVESVPAVIAALLVPTGTLVAIVLYLLVVFVFVLIGPLLILGIIGRNRKIMGDLAMGKGWSVVYWVTYIIIISTAILAIIT
jgi:Mn2+ and Fe2+ transporters of the NRAMP family